MCCAAHARRTQAAGRHLDGAACYDTVNAPAAQVKEVIELLAAGDCLLLITEGT